MSFPDKNACPDAARLEPPFSHLLDDHLLGRDGHSFESREHALSFGLSWPRSDVAKVRGSTLAHLVLRKLASMFGGRGQGKPGQIGTPGQILADQIEPGIDIHWHAFTPSLAEKTILAACALDGRSARLLAHADMTSAPTKTVGDILFVYHLATGGDNSGFCHRVDHDLSAAREVAAAVLAKLGAARVGARIPAAKSASGVYPAWIERTDRPAEFDLERPFTKEIGCCFTKPGLITRDDGDSPEHPQRSRFELLENGAPLGPPHAAHRLIREQGRGHYSHWQNCLYFSTSDNSDPNRNGRSYRLRLRDRS